jgi:hypothetical protein
MGSVYLGRDPALKRSVAIKVLAPLLAQDPVARARFTREAEAAAAVSHPHVVSVYQVGELAPSRTPYLVMQFIEGLTLQRALHEGEALPEPRVRRIVGEVASALETAHARGLVHRDIKPGNIMLEQESGRAVVLDFGISAVLEQRAAPGAEKLTATGTSIGTPMYMSPEQAAGQPVTDRSDVYSLGVVAFELATGRPPFVESSAMGLIAAHIKEVPPDVRSLRSDLDPRLADLINRCLVKDPARRPSAADLARALIPSGTAVIEWPPPGLERLRGVGSALVRTLGLLGALGLLVLVHPLWQPSTSMLCCWNQPERSGLWKLWKIMVEATFPVVVDDTDFLYVWAVFLMLVLDVVLVLMVVQAFRAWRLAVRLRWARRSGYPWSVLLDVAFDSRPDTAALLNRTGAYALVSDAERERLVRLRRRCNAVVGATVVYALAAPGLWFRLAQWHLTSGVPATTMVSRSEAVLVLLPAVIGLTAMFACWRPEARVRRRGRRGAPWFGRRSPPAVKPELVAGWLGSVGRRIAEKPRGLPRAVVWLIPAVAVLAAAFVMGIMASGMVLEVVITANERAKAAAWLAAHTVDSLRPMSWQSVDSVVASAAGVPTGARADLEAARLLGAVWTRGEPVPEVWDLDTTGSGAWTSVESRLGLWRRLARSAPLPALWPYRSGFRGVANPWVLPRARTDSGVASYLAGARETAAQNRDAALLALARGDKATALLRLRENVAVGRQLMGTPLVGHSLAGLDIVASASRAMAAVGRRTRDAAVIVQAQRLTEAVTQLAQEMTDSWRRHRLLMADPVSPIGLRFVGDTTLPPAVRWQLIAGIVGGACNSVREESFGVDPRRGDVLTRAGELAADIPRTDEWVALNRRTLERLLGDPVAAALETRGKRALGWRPAYAWLGLLGPRARGGYCGAVLTRTY